MPLPKNQNDVAHALAQAGGLTDRAADYVEVHRRVRNAPRVENLPPPDGASGPAEQGTVAHLPAERQLAFPCPCPRFAPFLPPDQNLEVYEDDPNDPKVILRIPLRGLPPGALNREDVTLQPGDVVIVPTRSFEIFFVVGLLDQNNLVGFSLGDRERELGSGLVLPVDRDIDVVTAVAMAGYIDPIESPTTVTLHRRSESGEPLLILVDLIAARFDRRETVIVQPGDIIYVNPDAKWWSRRMFDRIAPTIIVTPYIQAISKAIGF
jgi:hypothetical protein